MRVEVIEFHPDPDYDFQLIPGEQYDVTWSRNMPGVPHFHWLYDAGSRAGIFAGDSGVAQFRTAGSSHSFRAVVVVVEP